FGGGIASMIDPSRGGLYNILYTLLVLTYSTFCLTSLDTATRMGRFMFQEFWLDGTKGETPDNVTGYKKVLSNPYVATLITVVLGIALGMNGYSKIWALFGSANQLLAALALLAIAAWLNNVGRKSFMCWGPMFFMLAVTIASLFINTKTQVGLIQKGGADWGPYVQAVVGVLLIVLAIVLAIEGIQTIFGKKKAAAK
ncbi:MAG: carbon starvation protein A, partial [Clostridium sp.]|nr:carbon starvation protein A [Clostridium sp.]